MSASTSPGGPAAGGRLVVRRPGGFELDLDLELPAGTTTALLGPNGAGKTTVLEVLAGLLPLDAGSLRIAGHVVDDPVAGVLVPTHLRRVGVVFQDVRLFAHLSVRDNVAFGPRSLGRSRAEAAETATEWLGRVGLAALAARRPGELSGGQAQRVALARALATEPDLLLLDEPLSALDVRGRAELRRLLAEHLPELDAPRLLVTHDPVDAWLLADRVVVLEAGRATQVGTPADVRESPRTAWAAALVGTNLLRGVAASGTVEVGGHDLRIADADVSGPVLLAVHPHAVVLSARRPVGSQRNVWPTVVQRVEPLGGRTRVTVGAPVPLTAEVTAEAAEELSLVPGLETWVAVKATEVAVTPDA